MCEKIPVKELCVTKCVKMIVCERIVYERVVCVKELCMKLLCVQVCARKRGVCDKVVTKLSEEGVEEEEEAAEAEADGIQHKDVRKKPP